MITEVSVDTSVLTATLNKYIDQLGYDSKEVLKRGMSYTSNQLNKFTPYFNRKQGLKAVLRDVRNAVSLMEAKNFKSEEVKRMIYRRKYDAFNEAAPHMFKEKIVAKPFSEDLITSKQDARGHVRKPTGVVTFDGKAWRNALKRRQNDLFIMKKSYLPAILASGGQGGGFWMKAPRIDGTATPRLTDPNPTFAMENHAKGISVINRFSKYILAKVNKSMLADIRARLKHRAQQNNLKP
jgi:hypothetical protein